VTVARPAGLLLQIAGATLADVHRARSGLEPLAAHILASSGHPQDFDELDAIVVEDFSIAWTTGDLATAAAWFHRRLVELSGNPVLAMLAGVVHDITRAHTPPPSERQRVGRAHFDDHMGSCQRLIELLRTGQGTAAEAHWRRHLELTDTWWSMGFDQIAVGDVLDQ
jgi:GntR family transcriptional repressor for pyruvate dehydrogenase complex